MTPHFINHFDIQQHIVDANALIFYVTCMSLQLGFHFDIVCCDQGKTPEERGMVKSAVIKFRCKVGLKHTYEDSKKGDRKDIQTYKEEEDKLFE